MSEEQSLIPIESLNAVEVFTGTKLDELLVQIRQATATVVPDVSTTDGRKEIASLAYKVARSKTTIDEAGKTLVAEWKEKSKVVDAARKKARDYLDALKDEIRSPLDLYEAELERAEKERVEAFEKARAEEEAKRLADLEQREAEVRAKEAKIREAEEAVQRKAAEEQAAKDLAEREERIRQDAVDKAEWYAQATARKLEQDRLDAIEAERKAEEKRLANKRHCAKINNQIIEDLEKAGLTKDVAKQVVIAIASGKVSNTRISY